MKNDHVKLANGLIARRYRIIGTDHYEYEALRPTADGGYRGYSSFSRVDDVLCGVVGSELLPADLDALPVYSHERSQAVKAWGDARHAEARQAIVQAFPEARSGTASVHGISLTVTQDVADLGKAVARAIQNGDDAHLESLCLLAATYNHVRTAAIAAGVEPEALEEALARVS